MSPDRASDPFVEELFGYYRSAERPTLQMITDDIAAHPGSDAFTASRETIRKTLRGKTIPMNWAVVEAVLVVLCARAGINPDAQRWSDRFGGQVPHRQNMRALWNDALDAPPLPKTLRSTGWGASDPWASDAPPF